MVAIITTPIIALSHEALTGPQGIHMLHQIDWIVNSLCIAFMKSVYDLYYQRLCCGAIKCVKCCCLRGRVVGKQDDHDAATAEAEPDQEVVAVEVESKTVRSTDVENRSPSVLKPVASVSTEYEHEVDEIHENAPAA